MKAFIKMLVIWIIVISFAACESAGVEDSGKDQVAENQSKHYDSVIAEIINNEAVITMDMDKLKTQWEQNINIAPNLDVSLNEIYISKEDGIYYLVGRDTVNRSTTKTQLVLDDGKLYEAKFDME